jgi:hypothetical protein
MECHWGVEILLSLESIALVESEVLPEKETTEKRSVSAIGPVKGTATEKEIAIENGTEIGTETGKGSGTGSGTGIGTGIEIGTAGMIAREERNGNLLIDLTQPPPQVVRQKIVTPLVDRMSVDRTPRMATMH